jgi:hypothetical protein
MEGFEVLSTATQRDIEVEARPISDTAISIKNFRTPVNGITYYCRIDEIGNRMWEQDRRELQFHGGIPGITQRKNADEAERRRVQDLRWAKEHPVEVWQPPADIRAGSVPRADPSIERTSRITRAPSAGKPLPEPERRETHRPTRKPTPGREGTHVPEQSKKEDPIEKLTLEEEEPWVPYHVPDPAKKEPIIRQRATPEWMNDFSPEEWTQQWDGEEEGGFRDRTTKGRRDWINRLVQELSKASSKKRAQYAFYVELILDGLGGGIVV